MTGEPLPQFSSDPFVDFCVKEAATLAYKTEQEEAEAAAEEQREKDAWKADKSSIPGGLGPEPPVLYEDEFDDFDPDFEAY